MAALTHTQNVTRLYRKSLKHLLSWAIDRRLWRRQALELRDRFDANKDVDHSIALKLLQEGEAEFERRKHPDPYISPEAPEGTKWERNLPPPPHVLEMTPDEQKWYDDVIKYGKK
ncbi:PREDICTED: NADH dehydrogenase [ubiquinone] 1 beta subcomplex subunit 9-like [Amphimedon queenslandica]|uniref:NADH dehydrogenase [ubiquinone] 1 beta subcomplex subunit 9 n=1 Tax=Amphimedon queenslandica TaxID=400682 RepID=A0A1X7UI33_AMPQE|nr:PREDICTED: NADH dehydrogenase [ubiquinone] 1 beta subcomplex subunit 9-like [Amphimedon queenslandica]|eukprot:XP_003387932.1 PREDICTED: NADH dehydrogenase [ubiquinone] 1 beta subcomplex subunit 9-like [Amphimedon queenslandica]